jgi:hypothetical protein
MCSLRHFPASLRSQGQHPLEARDVSALLTVARLRIVRLPDAAIAQPRTRPEIASSRPSSLTIDAKLTGMCQLSARSRGTPRS